jgi:transaldolase
MDLVVHDLTVKLFLDGANLDEMIAAYQGRVVQGFTTNPTLMRKAGVGDYETFARTAIAAIPDLPISFEVFSDGFGAMEREARKISSWGGCTYIKVPITNTKGESAIPLIEKLSGDGLRLNVTAVMTLDQVRAVVAALNPRVASIVSVFAGRIADSGIDPFPMMAKAVTILDRNPRAELLWASPREVLNVVQANQCGCQIITITGDLLRKLPLLGKDLEEFSLDTVKMFYSDALAAGYKLR